MMEITSEVHRKKDQVNLNLLRLKGDLFPPGRGISLGWIIVTHPCFVLGVKKKRTCLIPLQFLFQLAAIISD